MQDCWKSILQEEIKKHGSCRSSCLFIWDRNCSQETRLRTNCSQNPFVASWGCRELSNTVYTNGVEGTVIDTNLHRSMFGISRLKFVTGRASSNAFPHLLSHVPPIEVIREGSISSFEPSMHTNWLVMIYVKKVTLKLNVIGNHNTVVIWVFHKFISIN